MRTQRFCRHALRVRRALAPTACLALALPAGCAGFVAVSSDADWSELAAGDRVLVGTRDDREYELAIAAITPTSVTGEVIRWRAADASGRPLTTVPATPAGGRERLTLERAEIASVQVRRASGAKTASLVGLVLALALVIGGDGPDYTPTFPGAN